MGKRFVFNRMEAAGSLGDLGALLPIAIATSMGAGMIVAHLLRWNRLLI
jgi:hypothetical protein